MWGGEEERKKTKKKAKENQAFSTLPLSKQQTKLDGMMKGDSLSNRGEKEGGGRKETKKTQNPSPLFPSSSLLSFFFWGRREEEEERRRSFQHSPKPPWHQNPPQQTYPTSSSLLGILNCGVEGRRGKEEGNPPREGSETDFSIRTRCGEEQKQNALRTMEDWVVEGGKGERRKV